MQLTDEEAAALFQAAKDVTNNLPLLDHICRTLTRCFEDRGRILPFDEVKDHYLRLILPRMQFMDSPKKSHVPMTSHNDKQPVETPDMQLEAEISTPIPEISDVDQVSESQVIVQPSTPQPKKQRLDSSPRKKVIEVITIDDSVEISQDNPLQYKEDLSSPVKIEPVVQHDLKLNRQQKLEYHVKQLVEEFNVSQQKVYYTLYTCSGSFDVARSLLFHQKSHTQSVVRSKYFTRRDDALIQLQLDKENNNLYQRTTHSWKDIKRYCQDRATAEQYGLAMFIPIDEFDNQYWSAAQMAQVKGHSAVNQRLQFLKRFEEAAVMKLLD